MFGQSIQPEGGFFTLSTGFSTASAGKGRVFPLLFHLFHRVFNTCVSQPVSYEWSSRTLPAENGREPLHPSLALGGWSSLADFMVDFTARALTLECDVSVKPCCQWCVWNHEIEAAPLICTYEVRPFHVEGKGDL